MKIRKMAKIISIPQGENPDYADGTTGIICACGGKIEWAEAAYVPWARACRRCLALYMVRGRGAERRLVPQTAGDGHIEDADPGTPDEDIYRVPENLYPGWKDEGK